MSNSAEGSAVPLPEGGTAGYRGVGPERTVRADRAWWDRSAAAYLADHGSDLAGRLLWGPEGLDESAAGLLGDVAGLDVLEVGAGAGQGSAWLAGRGARVVATDLSGGMLRHGPAALPRLQADARRLPFAAGSFDLVFTAYGALPFVADPERVHAEVARVLRPGGRWVFSLTHPVRWAFPDDPGPRGLTAGFSYFDRTAYAETDATGEIVYAEHHRTIGDRVRELVAAGFVLEDLVEPEWAEGREITWGGWSPERGELLPGTAIFVSRRRQELPGSRGQTVV